MVLVKKWPCFELFFLGNIGKENVFCDILNRGNAFLGYKIKNCKTSKNWHFSKGVNPWFWSKNGHFSNFFFTQYRPGKCILWYSRTKKRLSRPKKQEFQKVENLTFFQWFWSKNGHYFELLFLGDIDKENFFYDIVKRKNPFLGYENKKLKKWKNWTFFKGVGPWFWSKNGHLSNFFF